MGGGKMRWGRITAVGGGIFVAAAGGLTVNIVQNVYYGPQTAAEQQAAAFSELITRFESDLSPAREQLRVSANNQKKFVQALSSAMINGEPVTDVESKQTDFEGSFSDYEGAIDALRTLAGSEEAAKIDPRIRVFAIYGKMLLTVAHAHQECLDSYVTHYRGQSSSSSDQGGANPAVRCVVGGNKYYLLDDSELTKLDDCETQVWRQLGGLANELSDAAQRKSEAAQHAAFSLYLERNWPQIARIVLNGATPEADYHADGYWGSFEAMLDGSSPDNRDGPSCADLTRETGSSPPLSTLDQTISVYLHPLGVQTPLPGTEPPPDSGASGASESQDEPAVAISSTHTTPDYPPRARELGEQGTVRLRLQIDERGTVDDAEIERSSGYPDLDNEAVDWVKSHWRYDPATRRGVAVATTSDVAVKFSLTGGQ